MMKIAVDIDEVVVDLVHAILPFFNEHTGKKIKFEDVYAYKFTKVYDISRKTELKIVTDFYRTPEFDYLESIPGALSSLEHLSRQHELVLLTARFGAGKQKTPHWFATNLPNLNLPIIYAGDYQEEHHERLTKAEVCLREGFDCIIEDNAECLAQCAAKGIRGYLFTRPWNVKYKPHLLVTRVSEWEEIIDALAPYAVQPPTPKK